jgi:hypothetical protein
MAPIHRILVKTHHMTSRKKIFTLTQAAQNLQCSVLLKTGPHPPGIMLAEGEQAGDWLKTVKVIGTFCIWIVGRIRLINK